MWAFLEVICEKNICAISAVTSSLDKLYITLRFITAYYEYKR